MFSGLLQRIELRKKTDERDEWGKVLGTVEVQGPCPL